MSDQPFFSFIYLVGQLLEMYRTCLRYSYTAEVKSYAGKVKVKCTLVQALRLCTGRTAHRVSRGIALLIHDQRHQKGVRGQRHVPAALYPPGKTRYPLYRRLGGTQSRSGQVRKNLGPTRIRSPDRPARGQKSYVILWICLESRTVYKRVAVCFRYHYRICFKVVTEFLKDVRAVHFWSLI